METDTDTDTDRPRYLQFRLSKGLLGRPTEDVRGNRRKQAIRAAEPTPDALPSGDMVFVRTASEFEICGLAMSS